MKNQRMDLFFFDWSCIDSKAQNDLKILYWGFKIKGGANWIFLSFMKYNYIQKMFIRAYSLIINKINRSLYIIWLLEEITNNSNKYCIFGLTFQSPLSKSRFSEFLHEDWKWVNYFEKILAFGILEQSEGFKFNMFLIFLREVKTVQRLEIALNNCSFLFVKNLVFYYFLFF